MTNTMYAETSTNEKGNEEFAIKGLSLDQVAHLIEALQIARAKYQWKLPTQRDNETITFLIQCNNALRQCLDKEISKAGN